MSEFANELIELIRNLAKDADDPSGQIPSQWRTVQELGLVTIGIAENAGGSGGGLDDLLVVIRELAHAGIGTPIVEASTAAFAIGPPKHDTFDTIVVEPFGEPGSHDAHCPPWLGPVRRTGGSACRCGRFRHRRGASRASRCRDRSDH